MSDPAARLMNALTQGAGIAQQGYSRQLQMRPDILMRPLLDNADRVSRAGEVMAQLRQEQNIANQRLQADGMARFQDSLLRMFAQRNELDQRQRESDAELANRVEVAKIGAEGRGGEQSLMDVILKAAAGDTNAQALVENLKTNYPEFVLNKFEQGLTGHAEIAQALVENVINDVSEGTIQKPDALNQAIGLLEPAWDTLTPQQQALLEQRLAFLGGTPGEIQRRRKARLAQPAAAAPTGPTPGGPFALFGGISNALGMRDKLNPTAGPQPRASGSSYMPNTFWEAMTFTPEDYRKRDAQAAPPMAPATQPTSAPAMNVWSMLRSMNPFSPASQPASMPSQDLTDLHQLDPESMLLLQELGALPGPGQLRPVASPWLDPMQTISGMAPRTGPLSLQPGGMEANLHTLLLGLNPMRGTMELGPQVPSTQPTDRFWIENGRRFPNTYGRPQYR